MKQFTYVAGNVTSFASNVNFLLPNWNLCTGHDFNVFQKFPETIITSKELFLSKKGPTEGERVAQGHIHDRVGEVPVH